ncbi:MAG: GNAT superfamily N-acetyltransferase [Candidatus Azotimanducaceae bacterium]
MIDIRPAKIEDAALIHRFITDLAIYEKAEHEVLASISDIGISIFGPNSTVSAVICSLDGEAIGFAVFFYNYSTWLGKNGLFLEDLYVMPEHRGIGAGKQLLQHLAKIAVSKNCGRFEWNVLDWNKPALDFYEALGAKQQSEWIGHRIEGEALIALADSE